MRWGVDRGRSCGGSRERPRRFYPLRRVRLQQCIARGCLDRSDVLSCKGRPTRGNSVDSDTLTLTRDLIARRSITPEDAGCLALIAEHLARAGFTCERIDSNDVCNLWARWGNSG